jgi:hypothetical protein
MRTLEKVRPKLKLSPGPPARGKTAASAEKSDEPASG